MICLLYLIITFLYHSTEVFLFKTILFIDNIMEHYGKLAILKKKSYILIIPIQLVSCPDFFFFFLQFLHGLYFDTARSLSHSIEIQWKCINCSYLLLHTEDI